MKTLKKVMSILLALLMTIALFAVSASAAMGDTLETILANYTVDTPTYTQTFDNEASVAAFGTMPTGTASFDSTNKRLVLTKSTDSSTGDQFSSVTNLLRDYTSSIESKKFYLEYTLEGSASLGDVYVNIGTAANTIQTGVYFHFGTGLMDVKDGTGTLKNLSGLNTSGKNTIKQLYDFENHKHYMWVNDTLVLGDTQSRAIAQTNRTNLYNMYIKLYGGTTGESLYIDDVKIIPLVEKTVVEAPYMPSASGTPVYEETFDYINGVTDATADDYGYKDVNINMSASGNSASNGADMSITTKGELLITQYQAVHCWYFGSEALEKMNQISRDMIISMDVTMPSGDNVLALGVGTYANAKAMLQCTSSGSVVNQNNSLSFDSIMGENPVNLMFLIDKDTDTFSIWVDGERKVENAPLRNAITNYSDISAFNFRTNTEGTTITVDNLKIYGNADDAFYKIDKVMRSIDSIEDISVMGDDNYIVNINTANLPQTGATITVADSKDYYNGTDLIFPIKADTTDIAVTVSHGGFSESKTFEDVTIPSAYSFGEINWGTESPQAGSTFDCATIPAKVRNAASDNGRLFIAAALYDAMGETPIMNAVGVQTDTLTENGEVAEGFPIILDLTSLEEIPAISKVKVFLWDNAMVPFGTQYEKTYTK